MDNLAIFLFTRSLYAGQKIRLAVDLIVFDEIQASDGALKSLKYFYEDAPEYHIAGAGSLLDISLFGPGAFPVGKVNFIDLYPMIFMESLSATGSDHLRQYISKISEIAPLTGTVSPLPGSRRSWLKICEMAGTEEFRYHDLRHTVVQIYC